MSLESINSLPKTNGSENKINTLVSSLPKDKGEKLLKEQETVKQDTRAELSSLKKMMMQEVALNSKGATNANADARDEDIPEWVWKLHNDIQKMNEKIQNGEDINPDDFKEDKNQG